MSARRRLAVAAALTALAAATGGPAASALGLERGFVFHGADGMGEVSTTGATSVFAIEGGAVRALVFQPEDFGVERARPQDLAGGNAEENAKITRAVLSGARGGAWGAARELRLSTNAAMRIAATAARA